MIATNGTTPLDYESAVERFCTLVMDRVDNAKPGDVLFEIPVDDLLTAMNDFLDGTARCS